MEFEIYRDKAPDDPINDRPKNIAHQDFHETSPIKLAHMRLLEVCKEERMNNGVIL
jgi:hypothetical protein